MDIDKLSISPKHEILDTLRTIAPQTYLTSPFPSQGCYRLGTKDNNIIGQVLDQLEYEVVSENIRSYDILGTTIEVISWTWCQISLLLSMGISSSSISPMGFRMVGGAKPLAVGDVCEAEARIISVINANEGKIVKVKGFAHREGQCVIEVVSSLLYCGRFSDYENTLFLSSRMRTLASSWRPPAQGMVLVGERVLAAAFWHFSYLPYAFAGVIQGSDCVPQCLGVWRYLRQEPVEGSRQGWLRRLPARRFAGKSRSGISSTTWYPAWSHSSR